MSDSKEALAAKANMLRRRIAEVEADMQNLRAKLALAESKLTGQPVLMVSGLDMLWKLALPMSRTRSSKQQCRIEWNKIPKSDRPTVDDLLKALKVWNRCDEWRKDGHTYVPGLHKWIKNRAWEDLPEVAEAPSRARQAAPKVIPQTAPEEAASAADIASLIASLNPRRMNS